MSAMNPQDIVRKFEESQMTDPDKKLYKAGFQNKLGTPTEDGLRAVGAIWDEVKKPLADMIDQAEEEVKADKEKEL